MSGETKVCSKCGRRLPVSEFYPEFRVKSGLYSRCKRCQSQLTLKWGGQHRKDWQVFLDDIYGKSPVCECCGKKLQWQAVGNKGLAVHFDHRHGGTAAISSKPSSWLRSHVVNDKNKKIFLSCDFGILCHDCNSSLPTLNRKEWLTQATRYAYQERGEHGKGMGRRPMGTNTAKAGHAEGEETSCQTNAE